MCRQQPQRVTYVFHVEVVGGHGLHDLLVHLVDLVAQEEVAVQALHRLRLDLINTSSSRLAQGMLRHTQDIIQTNTFTRCTCTCKHKACQR